MTDAPTLLRLIGVYDADHTIRGEVAYWVGARLGRKHCALCEITHGALKEKSDWQSCRMGLPVPFDQVHRDERSAEFVAATGGVLPLVAAETDDGLRVLLDPDQLEACDGDPDALVAAIEDAVDAGDLAWPFTSDA